MLSDPNRRLQRPKTSCQTFSVAQCESHHRNRCLRYVLNHPSADTKKAIAWPLDADESYRRSHMPWDRSQMRGNDLVCGTDGFTVETRIRYTKLQFRHCTAMNSSSEVWYSKSLPTAIGVQSSMPQIAQTANSNLAPHDDHAYPTRSKHNCSLEHLGLLLATRRWLTNIF